MSKVDTTGIDRAELLMGLFNSAKHGGGVAGIIAAARPEQMTIEEAQSLVGDEPMAGGRKYFDYHRGRVLKCDVGRDIIDSWLYDRDNGPGTMALVVGKLRSGE